jgi:hypothetical protein
MPPLGVVPAFYPLEDGVGKLSACFPIDTELAQTFAGVFAQHRTWCKAVAYTDALTACDTPVKTCWELAEKAGHYTPGPFQSLILENQWDHHEIWNRIATSAARLVACPVDDPLGPGVAVDETARCRGHHLRPRSDC